VYVIPPKPVKKRSESPTKKTTDDSKDKKDGVLTKDHDEWIKYFDGFSEKYAGADIVMRP